MSSLPETDPQNYGPSALNVLLLYEDAPTAIRAKRLVDQLAEGVNQVADFRLDLWRFDLLNAAVLQQLDAEGSLDSDIVILSAHGQEDLPSAVRSWLDLWYGRNDGQPRALVLSLDERARQSLVSKEIRYLLEAAANHFGIEVFSSFGDVDVSEFDAAIASIRYRAETTSVLLDETLHRSGSFRDWGINE